MVIFADLPVARRTAHLDAPQVSTERTLGGPRLNDAMDQMTRGTNADGAAFARTHDR
jgi:hypothetical protein